MDTPNDVFNWCFKRHITIGSLQFHKHPEDKGGPYAGKWVASITASKEGEQFSYSIARSADKLHQVCGALLESLEEKTWR